MRCVWFNRHQQPRAAADDLGKLCHLSQELVHFCFFMMFVFSFFLFFDSFTAEVIG